MYKVFISLAFLLFYTASMAYPYTLEITKNQLQAKLSSIMPVQRKKFGVIIKVSKPVLDLTVGNDEAGVSAHLDIIAPGGISAKGTTKITGSLRYDPKTYQVFFKNPQIVSLDVEKVPKILIPQLKKMVRAVIEFYLSGRPVYTVTNQKMKSVLVNVTLKSVLIRRNVVKINVDIKK